MTAIAVAVFALSYVLIASRRLALLPIGRPAGALLGAVLMVVLGVLTPEAAYQAVDHDTIVLLFAMMLLVAYAEDAGLFERLTRLALAGRRGPASLLGAVALLAAGLSALLVNDTVCLFLTPLVVRLCQRGRLPAGPYLIAIATSSNIGSAATLVGNPQNMIIGSLSRIPFVEFALRAGPATLVGLLVNLALLHAYYGRRLGRLDPGPDAAGDGLGAGESAPAGRAGARQFVLVALVLAGVLAGFLAGGHLGFTALAGAMVLVLAGAREPRRAFARVDWPLLVFFCCLFVVVQGLLGTGLVDRAWQAARPALDLARPAGTVAFTGLIAAGSNIVSNVPMTLLAGPHIEALGSPALAWVLLAFVATVAGNLTLLGSVANIIVAERARDHYTLGFFEYLRFGLVSTAAVLAAGVPVLVFTARLLE